MIALTPMPHLTRASALFAVLACTACGSPRDASPMPEPPSLDLDRIKVPSVGGGPGVTVVGGEDSATPNSLLLAVDLDDVHPPAAYSVENDGTFTIDVLGAVGHEFRFQLVVDGQRSAPVDAFYLVNTAGEGYLSPSVRHDCLTLRPGYEVTFVNMGVSPLALENGCDGAITVQNARSRTGTPGSRTSTPLPLEIAVGESGALSLEFQGSAFESTEDTLFFDVSLNGTAIRYPVTLFAP